MTTIYWAGDSTVALNTIRTYPQTGIGQMFHLFLAPDVRVEDHAVNGRSTKSFLDEGRLAIIYDRLCEGDFLFVQFGHNDEKKEDPARYTEPDGEFCENLERFVNAARNKGAMPVLITPLARRLFAQKDAAYRHERYRQAVLSTAARLGVPAIDLTTASEALIRQVGMEKSADYYMHLPAGVYDTHPDGITDDTHLRYEGAVAFGALIARGLAQLGGEYAALLCEGFPPVCAQTSKEA